MVLQEKLDAMRGRFESKIAPDALAVMHRATDELLYSGIMDRILKVGDRVPDFVLRDAQGHTVRSVELLSRGPLVLQFFRGTW